jgi:hypothetical protein
MPSYTISSSHTLVFATTFSVLNMPSRYITMSIVFSHFWMLLFIGSYASPISSQLWVWRSIWLRERICYNILNLIYIRRISKPYVVSVTQQLFCHSQQRVVSRQREQLKWLGLCCCGVPNPKQFKPPIHSQGFGPQQAQKMLLHLIVP